MNTAFQVLSLTTEERFELNAAMQNPILKKIFVQQKESIEKTLLNFTFQSGDSMEAFVTNYTVEQVRLTDINKFINLMDEMSSEFDIF